MARIKYSHHGDNSIIAIFRNTLTPKDIYRIETAAHGITVCDYTSNYEFWQEYIRANTEGRDIAEAYLYSIQCSGPEQVSDESLLTFIRICQSDNLITLVPITEQVARRLRGVMEAFQLNLSSVKDSAADYWRMAYNQQYVDEDSSDFASDTALALERFKAEQAQLRLHHLKHCHTLNTAPCNALLPQGSRNSK